MLVDQASTGISFMVLSHFNIAFLKIDMLFFTWHLPRNIHMYFEFCFNHPVGISAPYTEKTERKISSSIFVVTWRNWRMLRRKIALMLSAQSPFAQCHASLCIKVDLPTPARPRTSISFPWSLSSNTCSSLISSLPYPPCWYWGPNLSKLSLCMWLVLFKQMSLRSTYSRSKSILLSKIGRSGWCLSLSTVCFRIFVVSSVKEGA